MLVVVVVVAPLCLVALVRLSIIVIRAPYQLELLAAALVDGAVPGPVDLVQPLDASQPNVELIDQSDGTSQLDRLVRFVPRAVESD